ncbi:poly [ADP-ribose] polymerase 1-like isoform X2 [Penaeus japonicus]|uniref:poly [ADP-ribose] polymerase 1-like isoform X2 n=1 Tax=Penaeus japonicus TaxID=27405 RepID=UPI001C70D693|nr:poly [ADP-ribose] polymerase 1-like isoform X2 [Penaeus japonicus]
MDDLPYRVEYAKSGRASCKACKGNIAKDTLRLAVMVQSPMFDGKVPNWYHQKCFFIKQRPKTVADIANFDSVRWEDQESIKTSIETAGSGGGAAPDTGGKGGKKGKGRAKKGVNDFTAEYAKSGRAMCRGCDEKILKDHVRISKKEYNSESAMAYGPVDLWHHVDCFVKKRAELGFFESGDTIAGFGTLSADDKNMLKKKLKKIEVKRKAEDEPDCAPKKIKTEEEEIVRKQSKTMFKYRDSLAKLLKKKELSYILEHNDQYMPTGDSRMLDVITDGMTFGALEPCELCQDGRLSYESGLGYKCHGNLTEWTKCTNVVKEPKRRPFKIPEELRNSFDFLNQYKFKGIEKRVWIDHGPSTAELTVDKENGSSMSSSGKPLEGMKFVIVGDKFGMDKKDMKNKIKELGGEVVSKVEKDTAAVITTAGHLGGTNKKIDAAKEHNIQCVSDDFLEEVEKGGALLMIQKKNMASWGGDPQDRVHASKSSTKSKESRFTKSMPDKQKIKLKGGAAVDPDSGLEDRAHVYKGGKKNYNCVLGMVDIVRGTNSYYKLQVLESDKKNRWWLFRSWGRIGTTIGNNKLESKEDLQDAIAHFEELYEEKTGNRFSAKEFNKVPGCWYPLDIDYGQEEEAVKKPTVGGSKSKLAKEVQELVALIFDVDTMKSALVEFEIDVKKMPLGKLSKKQIESAYKVLSEALKFIKNKEEAKDGDESSSSSSSLAGIKAQLLDCSNRFFTLIPHDFGMKKPPILDDEELIKAKVAMLDNLSEIEVAYNLLKSEGDDEDKDADPIDKHYRKLNTKIEVVDKKSDEFGMIKKYVSNTHASTHGHYKLVVEEAFKIERSGEKKRFKPFKQLHNRKLLWHGSRLTNFAGILSQGLRIAPPEAPVTGYMFGKGVYFADMVSKSANYCCTSQSNPTGLILLADVALGNMYERNHAEYVEKLPKGMHSTKGVGRTCPDPSESINVDGVEVPLGKGIQAPVGNTSLLYNEFIVYDVAQVNVKYLLKLKFDYRY